MVNDQKILLVVFDTFHKHYCSFWVGIAVTLINNVFVKVQWICCDWWFFPVWNSRLSALLIFLVVVILDHLSSMVMQILEMKQLNGIKHTMIGLSSPGLHGDHIMFHNRDWQDQKWFMLGFNFLHKYWLRNDRYLYLIKKKCCPVSIPMGIHPSEEEGA